MSAQKVLAVLAFVAAVVVAINVVPSDGAAAYAAPKNLSHDLVVGYRLPGDRLVLRQMIVKKSQWMQIVTVQKMFNTTRYELITQVKALDQKTNGNGAYASILGGGPGNRNVTLRFKSQRGHGINFLVELYAR